jgi:acyl-CoA dehydrogenase
MEGQLERRDAMNVDFTPDQLALQDGIRKVAARFTEEYWVEKDEARAFPWEFHQALAEGDWLGICIPEEYGGGGLGVTEASIVVQEIAASGACMNGASIAHTTMFSLLPIIKHGTPQQKERFLPRAASGDLHLAFAVTEPDAGTDTGRTSTFARKVDGGYLVSGKKVWITKAQEAERLLLLTRSVPASEVKRKVDGLTLFFAEVDRAHVDIRPIRKMGRNATDSNEVFIDDLFVPDEDLIGEPGRGFYTLLDGLNPERILNAQEAIGIGRAALRRACDYARDRVVFDRPIGMNQGIQFPLAEALAQLDAAELMCWRAARLYDDGQPCGREANSAKYLAAEAGFYAADRAVQTHGGYGYARDYHVERYFREVRVLRLGPVSQELVLAYLAEHVLGLPKSY